MKHLLTIFVLFSLLIGSVTTLAGARDISAQTAVLEKAPTATAVPTAVPPTTPIAPSTDLGVQPMIAAPMLTGAVLASEMPPAEPDQMGIVLGWLIVASMIVALVYGLWRSLQARPHIPALLTDPEARLVTSWAVPLLVVVGLGIAIYLAFVEVNEVAAFCGPIGDCNRVQTSVYSRFFGIPVAILGLVNYVAIGVVWLWQRPLNEKFHNLGVLGLLILSLAGLIFSIYLTFIELLVIHAVCAWCLSSAVIMTLLFIVIVTPLTKRPLPVFGNP